MQTIDWTDFERVNICVGTVTKAEAFPEARKPAYKVWVDFGPTLGIKKTSAQITHHYTPEELIGKQVLGVVNFPTKQIGPITSEFLLLGLPDSAGNIILVSPQAAVPNGGKLH